MVQILTFIDYWDSGYRLTSVVYICYYKLKWQIPKYVTKVDNSLFVVWNGNPTHEVCTPHKIHRSGMETEREKQTGVRDVSNWRKLMVQTLTVCIKK